MTDYKWPLQIDSGFSDSAWKPLLDPVEDWPLAFCDSASMPDDDLIECDQVRRHFRGATMYALDNPGHRWYYLRDQRPEEVVLMKMFDSATDVKAIRRSKCTISTFKLLLTS